jgi:uncharacterized protein YegL
MKENLTEIIIDLDRSGSMEEVKSDTIGSYNQFVDTQKQLPGEAKLSLVQFDDQYEIVYEGLNIQDVPKLTEKTFIPRGMTALTDSIGKTIKTVGERLANTPEEERPEKVIFVVLTDGHENNSKEYTTQQVAELIKHQQEKYSWEFVFLGADQNAWDAAHAYSINTAYSFGKAQMGNTISKMNLYTANYRSKGSVNMDESFNKSDEEVAEDLKNITNDPNNTNQS